MSWRSHPAAIGVAAVVALSVLLTACNSGGYDDSVAPPVQGPPPPPSPPPPPQSQFADATASSGINYTNGFINVTNPPDVVIIAPSGVAAGDYDDDGDIDIFIVRGDMGPNLLYRNTGNLVFDEVAVAAGIAYTKSATENYHHSGPMFADLDGDGDLDLFLGGLGGHPSMIYSNNGNGTFSDVTAGSGIDTMVSEHSISAAFGDYDLDGYLDLFIAHWGSTRDFSNPGDTEHLWHNDTDATGIKFSSVSVSAGISPTILTLPDANTTQQLWDFTFAPAFARINDDLYPDIVSVADFNYSQYFINNQDGTFTNATDTDVIIDGNGMGSAVGDYDNDGDLDWFVTSIECLGQGNCDNGVISSIGNRLYRNNNGVFEDATAEAGVGSSGWGWGACFIDFDNDGNLDIYHTNGWPRTDNENDFTFDTSRAFMSDGMGSFENMASDMGLDDTEQGRGIVCADLDADGDVDILQLHRSPTIAATLRRNDTDNNNFLSVKLNGNSPNTQAAGARITVTIGVNSQMREISIASNFVSQNPTVQIFGLGNTAQVDELKVQWPDGSETVMMDIQAGQFMSIDQPAAP